MHPLIKLLRPQQWYKNLLVFIALFFSGKLLQLTAIQNSLLAFISFCALSSATYIINDYADRERDRTHPEKKTRPLAAGTISVPTAITTALLLLALGFSIAVSLPYAFLYSALLYFALSQLYTAWLKHEAFADVITLAINFVIRAVAGAFAIQVWPSPWLISCVFFLALFLVLGKRRGELTYLKHKAKQHRQTLNAYTPELVKNISILSTACLIFSYTLYVFFGDHPWLYLTLPLALYTVFRYESHISSGNKIARHPEYVFNDAKMVLAILSWGALTIAILYLFPK